jgi:hypothetical protein
MKRISSYQRLKQKKLNAEKELEHIKDDLEAIILRPYSSRAKNVRQEIKLKHE